MESKAEPISLNGGPFDGKHVPKGLTPLPPRLKLAYLPDPPDPEASPGDPASYTICVYAYRGEGRVEFLEASEDTMSSGEYAAIKAAQDMFSKLQKLVSDSRLIEGDDRPEPAGGFPLPEAQKLKDVAVGNFRRQLSKDAPPEYVEAKSNEQLWASVRALAEAELAWASLGSPLHLNAMRGMALTIFGLDLPLESGPATA